MGIERFEDIEGWQMARRLCQAVHEAASTGTFARDFALRDQVNRASGSAMDNIAEGFDSGSNPEFARFLSYAQRSCSEVMSQLYRALDRGHVSEEEFGRLYSVAKETRGMIGGFIHYLKSVKAASVGEAFEAYETPAAPGECVPSAGSETTNHEPRTRNRGGP